MNENGNIAIKLRDGTVLEIAKGDTALQIAARIGPGLAKAALAARLDGRLIGMKDPIESDGELALLTFDDKDGRNIFWHSSAHLMAQAVKRLYPDAQLGIGPSIADGFYYDIDLDKTLTPEDFSAIEEEMKKIVDEDLPVRRIEFSKSKANQIFKERGEQLKIDLIKDIDEDLSAYEQGEFLDLCRGPHLISTSRIGKNFKILSVAGAYWRGDEKNKQLQRLYATSYPDKKQLKAHLHRIEEAAKRDHRKLGRELDLFSIQDEVGGGLVLWHPKGAIVREVIESFWKAEHVKNGYQLVNTPHVAKLRLWERSGHTDFYQENMFTPMPVEEVAYQLKPMNCPFHITIYNTHIRSYRDLPIRYAELGTVYRFERSGVLHGLMRVRGFTQDDAHVYCRPEQLTEEIKRVLEFTTYMLRTFGFSSYDIFLSTRPEKYVGTVKKWDTATESLRTALEKKGLAYEIDPGEGVFYGPKIDIKIKDVLGRSWQCSTIQVDFNLPERFEISYVGEDGVSHQPIMIHRALLGSLERFFGVLIEHYAGNFPLWLAPVQMKILPITDRQHAYARQLESFFASHAIRVDCDLRNEKIGFKIRESELDKIPYMVIIGDKELENETLALRKKGEGTLGEMKKELVLDRLSNEINTKV